MSIDYDENNVANIKVKTNVVFLQFSCISDKDLRELIENSRNKNERKIFVKTVSAGMIFK